ncbi:hypothetical protein EV646_109291 [Kribbella antiqua]|uniref:Uncharacterized protein n=1 Tax=Kribbella antiqua TaxID=2512217 RepID=A0A4R2ILB9_9ACTN|nr:hypothetical protein [Kribbella antiqua]TCO45116.1 hypothetical protein EV646_109291 [Kribbella antiqua]
MRRLVVVLMSTAALAFGLTACGSTEQPAGGSTAGQSGAGKRAVSPADELSGIGSTLDAIDSELASDGSP